MDSEKAMENWLIIPIDTLEISKTICMMAKDSLWREKIYMLANLRKEWDMESEKIKDNSTMMGNGRAINHRVADFWKLEK